MNTLGQLLEGFEQQVSEAVLPAGHDQGLFDSNYAVPNLSQGQQGRQRHQEQQRQQGQQGEYGFQGQLEQLEQQGQNQQHQNGRPSPMLNGPNAYFAAAAFIFVTKLEVT